MKIWYKYVSLMLLISLLFNSVICSPVYAESISNNSINDSINQENTEDIVETTSEGFYMNDEVESSSGIIVSMLDKLFSNGANDSVVSGSAIDYQIDESSLPSFVLATLDDNYDNLTEDDKFQLNTYLYVREDTMTECCNSGYSVRESIPYALLMQTMDIDLNTAINMVVVYESQEKAIESANSYSSEYYQYACLKDVNLQRTFKEYVLNGYYMDKLLKAYAVSVYMGEDLSQVILYDEPENSNVMIDSNVEYLSEEYFINIETAEEILNECSLEEIEQELEAIDKILKEGDSDIAALSSSDDSESGFDSTFKRGPLSYVDGLGASVDTNTGSILYKENICSIPGVSGLDLDINIYYTSSCPVSPKAIDSRVNVAHNWRYSFAYLVDKKGGPVQDSYPRYLTLKNGDTYEILYVADYGYYIPSSCYNDEFKMYEDRNHQGSEDTYYKLVYKNGNIDYFDKLGLWTKTVDKFGNKIEVTESGTGLMKIKDTNNNIITISTNNYVQTITRPDNSQITINYSQNSYGAYKRNTLDKITYPGNISTEFTYELSSKDNYKNALLKKIKTPTGLEKHFSYSWTDRLKYTWDNNSKVMNYEADKYDYARINEEYLYVDGKTCDKKTYSYDSNFMVANSNFAILCVCDCACYPYLIGGAWDCNKLCDTEDGCGRPDCPYVYINRTNNTNYSTTVTSANGTTIKYQF